MHIFDDIKVTYNTHITGAKHKKKEKNKALMRESKPQDKSNATSQQPPKPKKPKKSVIDFRVRLKNKDIIVKKISLKAAHSITKLTLIQNV